MKELFTMWQYNKMVVLVALSAAMYAAVLIPFQSIPLIPGHTSLRIANVLPVALGLFFGPAGAWGAGIGNLIGDMFGTLSPGAVGGFVGNFLLAWLSYKVWSAMSPLNDMDIRLSGLRQFARYEVATIIAALAACTLITWWVSLLLRLAPPNLYYGVILPNELILPMVATPLLVRTLGKRVEKWGLLWSDIMKPEDVSSGRFRKVGLILAAIGAIGSTISMSYFLYIANIPPTDPLVIWQPVPFCILFFLGGALMGGKEQIESRTSTELSGKK